MGKKYIIKQAYDDPTSFNETVPNNGDKNPNQFDGTQGQAQNMKKANISPATQGYAAVPMEAPEGMQGEEQTLAGAGLPQEMIDAAHSFLGQEVLQAAQSGDPAAQDLYARTAAQLASSFMQMSNAAAAQQQPPQQGTVDENGQPMEGLPVDENGQPINGAPGQQQPPQGITTPEQDIAQEIVPDTQAAPPQQQGGPNPQEGQAPADQEGTDEEANPEGRKVEKGGKGEANKDGKGGEDDKVDLATVAKLIALAKKGHI